MAGRYTYETSKDLRFDFWLVFSLEGDMRLTRREPDLSRNERAMFLAATLPKSLFSAPTLRAEIKVDGPDAVATLNVETIGEALKAVVGADVDIIVKAKP